MRKEAKQLIEQAQYELKVARDNLPIGNYATVAFNCQQAVEKLLKAVFIIKKKEEAPKTHSLRELLFSLSIKDEKITKKCLRLSPHYFQARYPDAVDEVPFRLYTKEIAEDILANTKEIFDYFSGETDEE